MTRRPGFLPRLPKRRPTERSDDALSDVLQVVRLTGALFFIVHASPPWVAEAPESSALAPAILPRAQHVVSYRVIVEGSCWCHMAGLPPLRLDAGDVIVVPHGDAYALSSGSAMANRQRPDDRRDASPGFARWRPVSFPSSSTKAARERSR